MQAPRPQLFAIALIGVLLLMAWSDRFIQDDAFIRFQYARNLAEGRGLVWNQGERGEGYDSFLWTVLMAAPIALGRDPVEFSFVAGMACLLGVLLVTWRLCGRCQLTRGQAMLVLLILGTNYSFSAWATGGCGTMLQTLAATALVHAAAKLIEGPWPPRASSLFAMSLLIAVALLVRLDSAVFVAVTGGAVATWIWRWTPQRAERARRLGWLIGPAVLIVGAWFAWKFSYYGTVVPNAFHEWAGTGNALRFGLFYVYIFFLSYLLVWLPFVLLSALPRLLGAKPSLRLVALAPAAWLAYAIVAGGDDMEFRMIVPALPMLAIVTVWVMFQHVQQISVRNALLLLTFIGTIHHAITFDGWGGVERAGVQSIPELASHVRPGGIDWISIGRRLGHDLGGSHVVIATTAAGAIPYYSRLDTVDMSGRNDPWIARHGIAVGNGPARRRLPTLDYLLKRNVNLVLGDPIVLRRERIAPADSRIDLKKFRILDATPDKLPPGARVIDLPLGGNNFLECLCLIPNPAIDRLIQRR
ncbi:hypothetical protein LLG95_02005 [bacterium]|nr:hypothetical protein [bacterium]